MSPLASQSFVTNQRFLGAAIPSSITYITPDASRHYARRFSAPRGTIHSVGAYVRQDVANVWGQVWCGVYDDDGGEPGKMLGLYNGDLSAAMVLLNTTAQVPRWLDFPCPAEIAVAGLYWAVWWCQDVTDIDFATDATAGAGTGNSGYQTAGGSWMIEKGATGYTWTATANAENIIRVLHRS